MERVDVDTNGDRAEPAEVEYIAARDDEPLDDDDDRLLLADVRAWVVSLLHR